MTLRPFPFDSVELERSCACADGRGGVEFCLTPIVYALLNAATSKIEQAKSLATTACLLYEHAKDPPTPRTPSRTAACREAVGV